MKSLKKIPGLKTGLKASKKLFYLIFSFTNIFVIAIIFLTISCSSLLDQQGQKTNIETRQDDAAIPDITEQLAEETLGLEEETTVQEIDYRNAVINAEMSGYIPSFLCTDRDNFVTIAVKNTSDFTWRNKRPSAVRVGYHYYGQIVDFVDYDKTSRSEFASPVEPGDTVYIEVLINDITNPGYYVIQIDLVMEGSQIPENNFWFSSKGVKMIEGLCFFDKCQQ